ncbi:hypothetical protein EMIT047CA2_20005 [Pseudomonas soli]
MQNRHDQLPAGIGHADWHFAIFEGMLVGFPRASYSAPSNHGTGRACSDNATPAIVSPIAGPNA